MAMISLSGLDLSFLHNDKPKKGKRKATKRA